MTKTRTAIGVATLAAAVLASALTADYTLNYTPKVGTVTKYKMTGNFDFEGQEIMFTANVTNKVTKVNPDGSYTMEEAQTDAKVSFGGQEMEAPAGSPNMTTFDAAGRVLDIQGDMVDASAYRTAAMSTFYKPSKAVKLGDSWTVDLKADEKIGTVESKATYTVEAEEQVGQWKTVRISYEVKEVSGSTPASSSGKIWIDPADGEMVKVEGVWKDVPVPGAPAPITGKVVVARQ
jgi:hypothetical protein